eukprot:TRINITY_DN1588_c0_g2_i2.p1 TRINITY_DN1588_c0_g2~~TRINITY_DN1588_c0_g2_i2.p1  ORF type:complete len:532 (+),score=165.86 TRINITY_DN1588_c0_g2_i2:79-1596(+)
MSARNLVKRKSDTETHYFASELENPQRPRGVHYDGFDGASDDEVTDDVLSAVPAAAAAAHSSAEQEPQEDCLPASPAAAAGSPGDDQAPVSPQVPRSAPLAGQGRKDRSQPERPAPQTPGLQPQPPRAPRGGGHPGPSADESGLDAFPVGAEVEVHGSGSPRDGRRGRVTAHAADQGLVLVRLAAHGRQPPAEAAAAPRHLRRTRAGTDAQMAKLREANAELLRQIAALRSRLSGAGGGPKQRGGHRAPWDDSIAAATEKQTQLYLRENELLAARLRGDRAPGSMAALRAELRALDDELRAAAAVGRRLRSQQQITDKRLLQAAGRAQQPTEPLADAVERTKQQQLAELSGLREKLRSLGREGARLEETAEAQGARREALERQAQAADRPPGPAGDTIGEGELRQLQEVKGEIAECDQRLEQLRHQLGVLAHSADSERTRLRRELRELREAQRAQEAELQRCQGLLRDRQVAADEQSRATREGRSRPPRKQRRSGAQGAVAEEVQ